MNCFPRTVYGRDPQVSGRAPAQLPAEPDPRPEIHILKKAITYMQRETKMQPKSKRWGNHMSPWPAGQGSTGNWPRTSRGWWWWRVRTFLEWPQSLTCRRTRRSTWWRHVRRRRAAEEEGVTAIVVEIFCSNPSCCSSSILAPAHQARTSTVPRVSWSDHRANTRGTRCGCCRSLAVFFLLR